MRLRKGVTVAAIVVAALVTLGVEFASAVAPEQSTVYNVTYLRNDGNGKCITTDTDLENFTYLASCDPGSENQQYFVEPQGVDPGGHMLVRYRSVGHQDTCLGVSPSLGGTGNPGTVGSWGCLDKDTLVVWAVDYPTGNHHRFWNQYAEDHIWGRQCLDVGDQTLMALNCCNTGPYQQWSDL